MESGSGDGSVITWHC